MSAYFSICRTPAGFLLLMLALAAGVLLMAWVQNRRPNYVEGLVRFPGHLACAAVAGLGADEGFLARCGDTAVVIQIEKEE